MNTPKITNKLRAEWLLLPDSVIYIEYRCDDPGFDPGELHWIAGLRNDNSFSDRTKPAAIDKAVRHWLKTRRAGR